MTLSYVMRTQLMSAFVVENGDTQVEVKRERVGGGAGRVKCFACGGAGSRLSRPDCIRRGSVSRAKVRALFW
jgi:hypothetical protein